MIDFMRGLLSGALKDNSFLFKGVLTGIYLVAWDSVDQSESLGISKGEIPLPSIFSGLNSLSVLTVFDEDYATYFGFTETEVERLFNAFEVNAEDRENIKRWYNGYNFGGHVVYNPWSLLNYLRFKDLMPYWINTSSNDLIQEIINDSTAETRFLNNTPKQQNFHFPREDGVFAIGKTLLRPRHFVATYSSSPTSVIMAFARFWCAAKAASKMEEGPPAGTGQADLPNNLLLL